MMHMYVTVASAKEQHQQQFHQQLEQLRSFMGAHYKENVEVADDYTTIDIPTISARSSFQKQVIEMTRLAMSGCDLGERIAISHQKRPCFKKIDSLCARMKQDLTRNDGVLANINSQGIAWAVKDLIFVMTRIINGWNIIKGYANNGNNAESLNKVRAAMSPTFNETFIKWQEVTMVFLDDLIRSFASLDQLAQTQRGGNGGQTRCELNSSDSTVNASDTTRSSPGDDSSNESFTSSSSSERPDEKQIVPLVVENSEEAQMKHMKDGTYFKTGVYNPIRNDTTIQDKNCAHQPSPLVQPDLVESAVNMDKISQVFRMKKLLQDKLDNENINKYLINKIETMAHGEYFFSTIFVNNYFPDFCEHVPDFVDLRSIILKNHTGGYKHINQIVHDLRQVVYSALQYLAEFPHAFLQECMTSYEQELETILADSTFAKFDFSGITGAPTDNLEF